MARLAKEIDIVSGKSKLKSFFVYHGDSFENLSVKLKEFGEKQKLSVPLTVSVNDKALKPYGIPDDAEIYVVLYDKRKVVTNLSWKESEFNKEAEDAAISEVKKLAGIQS